MPVACVCMLPVGVGGADVQALEIVCVFFQGEQGGYANVLRQPFYQVCVKVLDVLSSQAN